MPNPVDIAIKEIGYTEGKNNENKYSKALGRPAESWCADFIIWCFHNSGHAGDILNSPSVIQICKWAEKLVELSVEKRAEQKVEMMVVLKAELKEN